MELDSLLDRVQREGAVVPPLWISEAANVLLLAQRRGRIDRETMQERLALLDMLPIETDNMASGAVWRSSVLTLADAEALTFYDATYLELAIRRGLPLGQQRCSAASRRQPSWGRRGAGRTTVIAASPFAAILYAPRSLAAPDACPAAVLTLTDRAMSNETDPTNIRSSGQTTMPRPTCRRPRSR